MDSTMDVLRKEGLMAAVAMFGEVAANAAKLPGEEKVE